MIKRLILFLSLLALLGAGSALAGAPVTSVSDLNDASRTIGINTDTLSEISIASELPLARTASYTDVLLGYMDVANGKIDAFVYDRVQMEKAIENGLAGVRLLDDVLKQPIEIGIGISRTSDIPDLPKRINQFLASLREEGTLEDMYSRWVIRGEDTMPDIPLPKNPEYHLTVGTSGIVPPYSYEKGAELWGHDIELARRLARYLNADLTLKIYDYSAVSAVLNSGEADCFISNLQKFPSREESILMSDALATEQQGIMVRDTDASAWAANSDGTPVTLSQFNGKKVGVQTGTNFDQLTKNLIPGAEIEYYNTKADLVQALSEDKIQAIAMDEPVIRILQKTHSRIVCVEEPLDVYEFAYAFPQTEKGARLRDQFNEFLGTIVYNGTMDELLTEWFSPDDVSPEPIRDYEKLPATNGVLRMATESGYEPFEFVQDGVVVGYDVDIAALFCKAYGYRLEVVDMNYDAILPSVNSGKCDFGGAGISITPERAESVYFSDPNYSGSARVAVMTSAAPSGPAPSFWDSIRSSFEKTFLRENRWRLFLSGIITTMIITLSTILAGTVLGFLVFLMCRKGNPVAQGITAFMTSLLQGMPLVVLLMIFYYIIFGNVAVSGILVSVIAFSLTFGASVYSMLRMGVGAVDRGQYEAAWALGYSDRRTFFKIILPQALPHVMPAYQGEIVSLLKSTAVVGYIAVQDLTKISDIVRSRTYEAFFPLIAITVIYFALEALLGFLVSRIRFNPRRRKTADILKGVKTDDQH